jgi:hypothetical protein
MNLKFNSRVKYPYGIKDDLYICSGGTYRNGEQVIPDSVNIREAIKDITGADYRLGTRPGKWEDRKVQEWFRKQYADLGDYADMGLWWFDLKNRSHYRVRVGAKNGNQWAQICIEFQYFSDRDPGSIAFWTALDSVCWERSALWHVIDSRKHSAIVYYEAVQPTKEGVASVAKTLENGPPRIACILYDLGKPTVAVVSAHDGRPEWQVEVCLPTSYHVSTQASLDICVQSFIEALAGRLDIGTEHNYRLALKAVESTLVNVF